MSAFPEHDRLHAVVDQSQAIGEFLDWMLTEGWQIEKHEQVTAEERCPGSGPYECREGKRLNFYGNVLGICRYCGGTGKVEMTHTAVRPLDDATIVRLLASYFEIDQNKLEAEKRAMLEAQRALNRVVT